MGVRALITSFRTELAAWEEDHDPVSEDIARRAYDFCREWLGDPIDSHCPYMLIRGHSSACAYSFFDKAYMILISVRRMSLEERSGTIAHEMFHRFTQRRPGIHKQLWISEMLAALFSQWFLEHEGMDEYAAVVLETAVSQEGPVGVERLRRHRRPLIRFVPNPYPPGYASDILCLGSAMEAAVGRKILCRLVGAPSLEGWLAALPETAQALVNVILSPSITPIEDPELLSQVAEINRLLRRAGDASGWEGGLPGSTEMAGNGF
jgi:hypothetical protein